MGAIVSSEKAVTTGGTPEALVASATMAHWVRIQGKAANTNNAYVGVVADPTTGGEELDALQVTVLEGIIDLNTIIVDVDTDGEGVNFTYMAYP